MIIETKNQLDIENIGATVETIEAGIDASSMPFLFEMLSGSLYSNPIESICREITSNCFDSHIEANVDEPVIVRRGNDEEGTYISFIDVGVGLSPKRIQEIYMNYFSSTKRLTNDQIGGFGLGSKSPLSYTEYFYITTVFDSIKYQYIFSKGKLRPSLDLLDKSDTIARNGTEIKIYIKEFADITKFETALSKQLCYFDNVYFEGWNIENNYTIFEGTNFKYRNKNQYDSKMHIVLDKVVYPIDWKILGISPYNIAVGVKFQIGELQVTPNREQLRYTDEIIELVNKRIEDTIKELISIFDKQNKKFDSFFEWYLVKDQKPFITFTSNTGVTDKLYLYGLDYVNKKSTYKYFEGIEDIVNLDDIIGLFYNYAGEISNGKKKKDGKYHYISYTSKVRYNPSSVLISNTSYLSADKSWLASNGIVIYPSLTNFRRHRGIFRSVSEDSKSSYLNKYYFNLGAGLKIYKLMKALREEVNKRCKKYRELTEDEQLEYKEYKIDNNTSLQKRLQGKVFVTSISMGDSYDWNIDTIVHSDGIKSIGINNYKGIVIYGFKEDQSRLERVVEIFKIIRPNYFNENERAYGKKFNVIKISKQNERYFKNKDNMAYVEDLYGDNIIFRDIASLFKIECFFNDIQANNGQSTLEYIKSLKLISNDVGEVLEQLYTYYDRSRENKLRYNKYDLKREIIRVAEQYNLFNPEVELLFSKVENWFKGVEIIRYMNINDKTLPYILKLLYEKKKKLNIEYYQRVLKTDKSAQLSLNFDTTNTNTKFNLITQNAIL